MPDDARGRYALEGIRILDLTQVAIGPYATLFLAGLGAEVIKVESNRRPDTSRGPVAPAGELQLRQYPDGEPGAHPWNRTAYFNQRNRGKLGIMLDFSRPEGRALILRLAAVCDALVENYRASVLERQGLGWEALREANPRLVYLKLSSQGDTGPEREYGSLGSTLEQTAGLASITGYTDGVPLMTNLVFPDPVGGILGVGALVAGLRRARRTGRGQFLDFAQREMTAGLLGEAMMDYALNGRVQGPAGNRHPWAAPHGVYPCRGAVPHPPAPRSAGAAPHRSANAEGEGATGDDRLPSPNPGRGAGGAGLSDAWIAIAVETDAQWAALRQAMGGPAWSDDPRFATALGRWHHQDEIDVHLAQWTCGFEHRELMGLLQRGGVPAGAVLTGGELLADPQLAARGWWEHLAPTEIGRPFPFVTAPWRMSASPYKPGPPAPLLGEHNDRVYLDLLGLSRSDYDALRSAGVISTEPLWKAEG